MSDGARCAGPALALVLLAGCVTPPEAPERVDGTQAKASPADLVAARHPVNSVGDAIAKGDEARLRGDTDEALFYYIRALEHDEGHPVASYKIGEIHAERENFELAERAFRLSLLEAPDEPAALEGLALVLLRTRELDDSKVMAHRALELEPSRWRVHNLLGVIADLEGEPKAAAGHYSQALELNPDSAVILNNLGYSRYLEGKWEQALDYFRQATRNAPDYDRPHMNRGLIYVRQEQYDLALQSFLKVFDEPAAFNHLGYLCMLESKYDLAEQFFNEAIERSPTYYPAANDNLNQVRLLRLKSGTDI